ncbi:VanZ family protein [Streptomyces sp. 549]|uniref:VanZ family protein n=1 Tax=Streptomyces sp. 549 TaxID=3049076 RepID=UPI0024C40BAB|nr:VanZ family protein [Streptomyces sp. 549]MDK1474953.1 VanZ family protein [Streptomyces sp. 549]
MEFTITSSMVLLPALAVWLSAVALTASRRRSQPAGIRRAAVLGVFGVYLAGVLHFTFFPVDVSTGPHAAENAVLNSLNLIPVLTADAPSFVLNTIMLMPLGALLPLLTPRVRSVKSAMLGGLAVSLSIEALQTLVTATLGSARSIDVNDLLANTLGAVLGYLTYRALSAQPWTRHLRPAPSVPAPPAPRATIPAQPPHPRPDPRP